MKLKYICMALTMSAGLGGCNYLDFDESTGLNKEEAYSYFDYVSRMVSAVYRSVPTDYGKISDALRESATDNALYTWDSNNVWDMYTGAWSPLNAVDNRWDEFYQVIYDANSLLENFDEEKLKRFEWNIDYQENIAKIRHYMKELEVMRAFYHFELAKRFGDVPLMTHTYELDEINSVKKTPFNEIIEFVDQEISRVAPDLVEDHKTFYNETGHVNRGIALAIRSRALLYAASPLFAGEGDATTKWKAAAKAAYDVIALNKYKLQKWNQDPLYNVEGDLKILESEQLIWEVRSNEDNSFEARNLPIGFEGAKGGNTPTQNLVDEFDFLNGEVFDWNNPEHVRKMYYDENGIPTRDPRLYLNVICDGMTFMNQVVEPLEGGKNGRPLDGATRTGYYLRKLMNEKVSLKPNNQVKKRHIYPVIRYAEILLNYAEAMNEWQGPVYTDADCPKSALEALNEVRTAAGMPPYTGITDQNEFRKLVRKERRIELAFEDHRFWDIRRWKEGDLVKKIYGVSKSNDVYVKKLVQERVWEDKMYLYPIPKKETFVNENLTQNPGW